MMYFECYFLSENFAYAEFFQKVLYYFYLLLLLLKDTQTFKQFFIFLVYANIKRNVKVNIYHISNTPKKFVT